MIRQLQSTLIKDYFQELKSIDAVFEPGMVEKMLNLNFTFKFSQTDNDSLTFVDKIAAENNFPHWKNSGRKFSSLIVSFSSRNAVEVLAGLCEDNGLPVGKELTAFVGDSVQRVWEYSGPNRKIRIDDPLIMGILNLTPDSFSDGGKFFDPDRACRQAIWMVEEGADWIDLGAESTRPGSRAIDLNEEWQRLEPVLKKIRKSLNVPLSIDTYKSEIARRALEEGVDIVNDISGFSFDSGMSEVVARYKVPAILMHIKGTPREMQKNPSYENLMEEIYSYLSRQIQYAQNNGVNQLIVDPGIGFGKRLTDNFEIIRRLQEFSGLGFPVLVGPSRKSFIGTTLDKPVEERVIGTAAAVSVCLMNGANVIRVHDVPQMKQVLQILQATKNQKA